MSFDVKELRPGVAKGAVDVVLQDEHGNERVLRVSDDGVQEVEQGMLIPVSDELEEIARAAVSSKPQLGGGAEGLDPKATFTPFATDTGASPMIPESDRISRPHVGTGDVKIERDPTETQKVPLDEVMDLVDDD